MKKTIGNALPIALNAIEIKHFAGVEQTGLKNLPGDAQWIFLTGENGFGKTSALRAIAWAVSPSERSRFYEPGLQGTKQQGPTIHVQVSENEKVKSYKLSGQDGSSTASAASEDLPAFAAYGASRMEIAHDASSNQATDKSSRLYGLFRSDGVLFSIEAEMKIWEQRNPLYFNHLRNTLLRVLDTHIGHIYVDSDTAKVMYVELDNAGNVLPPVGFGQLSSAYRSIIAMVGDLLIRFYKIYPKETPPEEFAGIVLVDELDVHQHPKMQRGIPGILSGVFPKIQFIASINSPIPILGAPESAVFLKVLRSKEEGITLHHLDAVQVRNLTPNTLLTSPIFDFEKVVSDHHRRGLERLVTESRPEEMTFNEMLEQKLKEMAKAANIDPDLISK